MNELLILAILLEEKYTIYKIRQKIKNSFSVFLGASFGSIHPALKKLEAGGYISANRKMSKGGQKSSVYSITSEGKKYFKELMTAEIPESANFCGQLANIKLMLLDFLEDDLRKTATNSIKRYYEIQLLNTKDLIEKTKNNSLQSKLLNHHADKISGEINWVKNL